MFLNDIFPYFFLSFTISQNSLFLQTLFVHFIFIKKSVKTFPATTFTFIFLASKMTQKALLGATRFFASYAIQTQKSFSLCHTSFTFIYLFLKVIIVKMGKIWPTFGIVVGMCLICASHHRMIHLIRLLSILQYFLPFFLPFFAFFFFRLFYMCISTPYKSQSGKGTIFFTLFTFSVLMTVNFLRFVSLFIMLLVLLCVCRCVCWKVCWYEYDKKMFPFFSERIQQKSCGVW